MMTLIHLILLVSFIGARFNFESGGPGYFGDLYVLQGDAITEAKPMVLRRDGAGHLIAC